MFDHLMRDAARDLLRNEAEPVKRRIRSQLTSLGRSFLKLLEEFRLLQARSGQMTASSPRAEPVPPANPDRQALNTDAARPASAVAQSPGDATRPKLPAADVGRAPDGSLPPVALPGDKTDLLLQRGFQNRRLRRALKFKKPPAKSSSRGVRPGWLRRPNRSQSPVHVPDPVRRLAGGAIVSAIIPPLAAADSREHSQSKGECRMRRLITLVLLAMVTVTVAGCIVEPGRPGGGWCWWHPYRCR